MAWARYSVAPLNTMHCLLCSWLFFYNTANNIEIVEVEYRNTGKSVSTGATVCMCVFSVLEEGFFSAQWSSHTPAVQHTEAGVLANPVITRNV